MPYWLANTRTVQEAGVITRFDPRFWTVDFPRPMMAAVTTTAPDALRVDAVFYQAGDLAGLIWEAADRWDHPLLAYETARDFRGCRLSFHWRSAGVLPLDAVNGPTLTIEGRDASGAAQSWYVRLWNYATGTPEDADVAIDFATVLGGYAAGGAPVWAGDVDRMFISLVAPGYAAGGGALPAPVEGWAELTGIACDGPGAVLAIGDVIVPEHVLGLCTGYDDAYNQTPARLLRQALALGYRGGIDHYVGMSHYPRLEANSGGWYASLAGGVLNVAAAAWHRDFAARAAALGYDVIWSVSYELLDQYCWGDWKQRAADGSPAATGYDPPSTLLSPANAAAMGYLQQVAAAFLAIGVAAGLKPLFQVGEPWWWTMPDGRPCWYDAAAVAAFAPTPVASVRGAQDDAALATMNRAGACLAASTAALVAAARAAAPGCVAHLLTYLPTVLDPAAPEVRRANLPVGWAAPAFDVLQLEDYEWVTGGDVAQSAGAAAMATARLGYPPGQQHYLAGYAQTPGQGWARIASAIGVARARGVARAFVWALPEIARDGFVWWDGEDGVDAFDDVSFPLALGQDAEVAPGFSTTVLTSDGGAETRVVSWSQARASYDAGPGVRSEADIQALLAFFRARQGQARAFRFRDPFDSTASGESIGTGDGTTTQFPLVKAYGDTARRITRPVAGSVSVTVAGVASAAWTLAPGGTVVFDAPPPAGAAIAASFTFDVPVRFAEDSLSVSRSTFLAGEAARVPLIEARE